MKRINISARGLTFSALTQGNGPLVLMLHGLPRTSWEWHHQIPVVAGMGFTVVAPDMRGYCPGAQPVGVESYHVEEFALDVVAIADELGASDFHLIGTSIGASVAWRVANTWTDRVRSMVCINIAHPAALASVLRSPNRTEQQQKMSYFATSSEPGNERNKLHSVIERMELPEDEVRPYLEALDNPATLTAIYHWYRANTNRINEPTTIASDLPGPLNLPVMYIWPPNAGNTSEAVARANERFVSGPYRFEIIEDAKNFVPQQAAAKVSQLIREHLQQHS